MRGGLFLGLRVKRSIATEVSATTDLDDDEGALFSVESGRVGGGSV